MSLATEREADLQVRNVHVRRAGVVILAGVSLDLSAGRLLAVTGPSGAGKSTLLAVLAGLVQADTGSVRFGGLPVRLGDDVHLQRTGLVLQGYGLISVLTAAENVEIVLQCRGVGREEVAARAAAALRRLALVDCLDQLVEELSGGQAQRVAVARAIVDSPALLLADEPTAELDSDHRDIVLDVLRAEADRGAAVVIATHDPDVAAACDHELHLVDGRVSAASTV